MQKGWKVGLAAVVAGLVLGAGWWLGSPLFLDRTVSEAAPGAMSDMGAKDSMGKKDSTGGQDPMKPMPTYTGMFQDGDASHHASGTARIIEADGRRYLRLEEFSVTNGPDLYVVLAEPGMPVGDGIRLGALKGNAGSQNYVIPAHADLMTHSRVVVWCRAFNVTFGFSDLRQDM